MIKVAICDDDKDIRMKIHLVVKNYFSEIKRPLWSVEFKSGIKLLESHIRFDIIFLDIEMPGLNGIETALRLRKWDVNSKIIYVTNYENYKASAYKVHAFDYIDKPVIKNDVIAVLKDVVYYLDHTIEKQKYAFKTEEGIITLELDEIFYFEYLSRKVIIHGVKGNYTATYQLKELLEKFEKYNFASPHKSFIVNMLYIKAIKGFDIFIENGDKIPLAQKRAVGFKSIFNDFLQTTFDRI